MQNSFQVYGVEELLMDNLEINEISCKSYSLIFFFFLRNGGEYECMMTNAETHCLLEKKVSKWLFFSKLK